jgi:hypothetical protein
MTRRYLLCGLALLGGAALGGGTAQAVAALAGVSSCPRCPRCKSRGDVRTVTYSPQVEGKWSGMTQGRYLGVWDTGRQGPKFYCTNCSQEIDRVPVPPPPP